MKGQNKFKRVNRVNRSINWDHSFKTAANFHDFWPLPPYHRHSGLWRGFLILMYCDLWAIGTWGHPSPPKTCWRLKWMVPMISLAPYIYGWICLSQIFILLQILWIWFNSVDLGGNITTPNRGRIRTDSNESTDILDTELIPAGIKLYVQVVLKITYLLQKAFLSAYFFFNIHTYNYMSMIFEYRTLLIFWEN